MLFSCNAADTQHRIIDVSLQAIVSDLFPYSLGFRSQTLKLRFAEQGLPGRYLQHHLSLENVMKRLRQRFKPLHPKHIVHQAYIGETVSIIYAPFYVDKYIYDAVLNQPVTSTLADDVSLNAFPDMRPDGSLHFLPTLCPHCGWDLNGQRDSLVLNCQNCASVYQPGEKGFKKTPTAYLPDDSDDIVYLPFWRIKADISGIRLSTIADFVREANHPRRYQPGMDKQRFHYWSPAFKVRPQHLLRISRGITLSQPIQNLSPGIPKKKLHPVTLPLTEGLESQKITLAGILKPRTTVAEKLPGIKIVPESYLLVYLPFHDTHQELVQTRFSMAINKNMLAHAKNL